MEAAVRHRLLLSLRSEQALGLRSIRSGKHYQTVESSADEVDEAEVESASELSAPVSVALPVDSILQAKALDLPVMNLEEKRLRLSTMDVDEVRGCRKCRLCETRTQTVFGEGDPDAKIFFIGEGPGETEDQTGRPFVGRAGQLLDKMIAAMGLRREQVFIANIVKCRPPQNRVPAPDEVAACTPYLERQLEIVHPKVIVTLGLPAAKHMLNDPKLTMGRIRGTWRQWRGIKLMPTFHPSYVLRVYTEETRKAVWSDLQQAMKEVGLKSKPA
jgi:uracil-DNA glycosylase